MGQEAGGGSPGLPPTAQRVPRLRPSQDPSIPPTFSILTSRSCQLSDSLVQPCISDSDSINMVQVHHFLDHSQTLKETMMASAALVAMVVVGAAAAGSTPVLWLPLGDSITFGCGTDAAPRGPAGCVSDAGGYRVPLAWALSQAGFNVSTMGTLTTGPAYVPPAWLRHEGHPGWRLDQVPPPLPRPSPPHLRRAACRWRFLLLSVCIFGRTVHTSLSSRCHSSCHCVSDVRQCRPAVWRTTAHVRRHVMTHLSPVDHGECRLISC